MKNCLLMSFIYLLNVCFSVSAQVDYPGNLDDKNTPKIKSKGEIGMKDVSVFPIKSCIKFEPTLLARGVFAFGYERQLIHNLTFQGTAGLAWDKDFIQVGGVLPITTEETPANEVDLADILRQGRGGKSGYYLSGDAKVYFSNDIFNDGYFAFKLTSNYYNLSYRAGSTISSQNYKPTAYVVEDISLNIFNGSFSILCGTQFATSGTIKTTHDFYIGVGLNYLFYKKFLADTPGPNNRTNVTVGAKTFAKTVFVSFGYAIGIGL
jgi:hypothetical protein